MRIHQSSYPCSGGVDFSVDPSLVDPRRSPWMPNLYPDAGGILRKRPGWRVLHQLEKPIYGLYRGFLKSGPQLVAHAGDKLYAWAEGETPKLIRRGVTRSRGTAMTFGGRIYLLTGGEYLYYDGEECAPVADIAYVPCTVTDRDPQGGGTPLEAVNLLGSRRCNAFVPDGKARTFQLDAADLDSEQVEVRQEGRLLTSGYSVNRQLGQVTFQQAPAAPLVSGQSSLKITFSKTVAGYAQRICRCTVAAIYGNGAPDTLFFSGNPEWKNRDFYSGVGDPTYFPDLNYGVVGSEGSAVMGYAKVGPYLAVIKQDDAQDATIFLREPAGLQNGRAVYSLRQGVTGVGAVSSRSFASLEDEPLFLSEQGVYAIVSSSLTAERAVQNRSRFLDRHLTAQPGLEQACAAVWRGFYMLAAGDTVYLLDGRRKTATGTGIAYESYHFTDVPASCLLTVGDALYFGTGNGEICRFNTDIPDMARFEDYLAPELQRPRAVSCCYYTRNDDDGDPVRRKTMLHRGCTVTLIPYLRSSGRMGLCKDGGGEEPMLTDTVDRFTWVDLDFARVGFEGEEGPRSLWLLGGARNYLRLQMVIRNDGDYEGFGIVGITKTYVTGSYAKG